MLPSSRERQVLEREYDDLGDPLAPAKGLVLAVGLMVILWAIIIAIAIAIL